MSDAARTVLSGLLTNAPDFIEEVEISKRLTEHHFADPTLRNLFRAVSTFKSITGGVLTQQALDDLTRNTDAGTAALLKETFTALAAKPVQRPDALWAVQQLREDRERYQTTVAIRDSSEILSGSVTEEGGRTWAGPEDARQWLLDRIAEINSEVAVDDSPAADVKDEWEDIVRTYMRDRDTDKSRRPMFGIERLDNVVGGLTPGDLVMVAAPSGVGKSHTVLDLAYRAAVEQGLHVYFATSETVRKTVRCRLIARHSMSPRFDEARAALGLTDGLDNMQIDRGLLPHGDVERFFAAVAKNWQTVSGSLWLAQMPFGQSVQLLSAQLAARQRARPVDLMVVDYLALMSGSGRFTSRREELASIIIDAKHLATDFNKGAGIPVVSPWQINRTEQERMLKTGEPDLKGLAETAEAVNSADRVITLMQDGPRDAKYANIKINLPKNRDGQVIMGDSTVDVRINYSTSCFSERTTASSWTDDEPSMDYLS